MFGDVHWQSVVKICHGSPETTVRVITVVVLLFAYERRCEGGVE